MSNILFVNHPESQCGVWQMGRRFCTALQKSSRYAFHYVEVGDPHCVLGCPNPRAVIFNYRNTTLPLHKVEHIKTLLPGRPYISIVHEIHEGYPFEPSFSHYLTIDPTYPADNIRVFKTVPEIPADCGIPYQPPATDSETIVGTFGFATDGKGYEIVLEEVAKEFPGATFRLHIPFATYGDADGYRAKTWSEWYANRCVEVGIKPEITHDYLPSSDLVRRLAENHLNCLFYGEHAGRGVSGAAEYCLAARRPLLISRSKMFRHITDKVCVWPDVSLREALITGPLRVKEIADSWTADRVYLDTEYMLDSII